LLGFGSTAAITSENATAAAMSTSEVATRTMPAKVGNVTAAMTATVSATASESVSGKTMGCQARELPPMRSS
jgi:hypothetical protein